MSRLNQFFFKLEELKGSLTPYFFHGIISQKLLLQAYCQLNLSENWFPKRFTVQGNSSATLRDSFLLRADLTFRGTYQLLYLYLLLTGTAAKKASKPNPLICQYNWLIFTYQQRIREIWKVWNQYPDQRTHHY